MLKPSALTVSASCRYLQRRLFRTANVIFNDSSKANQGALQETSENNTPSKLDSTIPTQTFKPFIKNLFVGVFNKDVLTYPQIEGSGLHEEMNEMVQQLERYFDQIDFKSIDENAKIPDDVLQQLKDFGLFGQQIPTEYGGLGFDATRYARMAEVIGRDGSIAVTLTAHQSIGLKGILIAGTEEQKAKYLPKLASGEYIAAFCLTEASSGSDAASIQTKATLSEDGSTYYLNGSKIWISNGGIADLFTVFAKTTVTTDTGEEQTKITAFIVERDFGGITNGKPEDKLGIRGSNTCEVNFDNTPVPVENVLGEVGKGFKLAVNILNSGRTNMGSGSAGAVKKLLEATIEHVKTREQFGQKLASFGMIQEKLAKISLNVYAMESMAYLTSGLIDLYPNADLSLEAAILKVFSSESAWAAINDSIQIFGGIGYMKQYPYERYLRDARILPIFEGTNEILRLLIALTGMKHAGKQAEQLMKSVKENPFNITKLFSQKFSGPYLNLAESVHPSLKIQITGLERHVHLLKECVIKSLEKYKRDILNEQMILQRVADITINIYAMTACISRGSRTQYLSLPSAGHEITIVKMFVMESCYQNIRLVGEIHRLIEENHGDLYKKISEDMVKNGAYVPFHPLTKHN